MERRAPGLYHNNKERLGVNPLQQQDVAVILSSERSRNACASKGTPTTYIYTYIIVRAHIYIHTYVQTYMPNAYIRTYIHTYIHSYIHTFNDAINFTSIITLLIVTLQ